MTKLPGVTFSIPIAVVTLTGALLGAGCANESDCVSGECLGEGGPDALSSTAPSDAKTGGTNPEGGDNDSAGPLGDGAPDGDAGSTDTLESSSCVERGDCSHAVQIYSACLVRKDGRTGCWNNDGKLYESRPAIPAAKFRVSSAYNGRCFILTSGRLICEEFQGSFVGPTELQDIGITDVVHVAQVEGRFVGPFNKYAVDKAGTIFSFSTVADAKGKALVLPPTVVEGVPPAVQVATMPDGACALLKTGQVSCWDTFYSFTGRRIETTTMPVVLEGLNSVAEIHIAYLGVVGRNYLCARFTDKRAICWTSFNRHGEDGGGYAASSDTPSIDGPILSAWENVDQLTTQEVIMPCLRQTSGTVACWGRGIGDRPVTIGTLAGAKDLTTYSDRGSDMVCVIAAVGRRSMLERRKQGRVNG